MNYFSGARTKIENYMAEPVKIIEEVSRAVTVIMEDKMKRMAEITQRQDRAIAELSNEVQQFLSLDNMRRSKSTRTMGMT